MERLTNRDKEIPLPNADNALFWARVHEKLARYEDAEERCNPCKPTQPECGECEYAKPITNADRIRSMSDEELAGILTMQSVVSPPWCSENYDCPYVEQDPVRCDLCALDWLRQEVDT